MSRLVHVVSVPFLLLSCGNPTPGPDAEPRIAESNAPMPATPSNVIAGASQEAEPAAVSATDNEARPIEIEPAGARDSAPDADPVAPPAEFAACGGCHATSGAAHGLGPNLYGIAGQRAGSRAGFAYSEALRSSGLTWSTETLDAFLAAPTAAVPGTRMAVPGVADPERRRILVRYVLSLR